MKRIFSLFILLTLIATLCACNKTATKDGVKSESETEVEKTLSKKEMLSSAMELNWDEVYDEFLDNEARAINNYDDKIVIWSGEIYEIGEDYVSMANKTYNGLPVNSIIVKLDTEDLIKLEKYQTITVVGRLYLSSLSSTIEDAFVLE